MIFDEPEGATTLDPDEINGLKFDHITTRGELDELEQTNITQGLRWFERRRGGDVLTDVFIRQLYVRLQPYRHRMGQRLRSAIRQCEEERLHRSLARGGWRWICPPPVPIRRHHLTQPAEVPGLLA